MKRTIVVVIGVVVACIIVGVLLFNQTCREAFMPAPAKPVIYLYPDATSEVTVKLRYNGILDFTYPAYDDGWHVTA
ncbi:MAG: hypothetical protein FWD30_04250, partial [Dehalococcoidia bacterium]|nr:hypothetical protein [Dehalococcoidia bacterium]